jgi:hypothetical protein
MCGYWLNPSLCWDNRFAYHLLEKLGGGMGVFYKAEDLTPFRAKIPTPEDVAPDRQG